MRTVRIRENVKEFLVDKPRNTGEILDHINIKMRHGTTSQQLGNILSKDNEIVKVGYVRKGSILSGGYDICEWALVKWAEENKDQIIILNRPLKDHYSDGDKYAVLTKALDCSYNESVQNRGELVDKLSIDAGITTKGIEDILAKSSVFERLYEERVVNGH